MRYTKEDALRLVQSMVTYESDITGTTRQLFRTTTESDGWKDKKHVEFCKELSSVIQDIKNGVETVAAYREHLTQRINELG